VVFKYYFLIRTYYTIQIVYNIIPLPYIHNRKLIVVEHDVIIFVLTLGQYNIITMVGTMIDITCQLFACYKNEEY